MRIISFLLRSLLLIGGLAIVGALVAREALLIWATSQLQTDLKVLRQAANEGNYATGCLEQGATLVEGEQLVVPQVRFFSDTQYDLEIVCSRYRLNPTVLKSSTLPPFVQKQSGVSGVMVGDSFSGVTLEIFGRRRTVYVENKIVKAGNEVVSFGTGPVAACAGYGLTCCQLETEIGVGLQVATAQDCPRSCHTSCQRRPVLLSLTADPFIDSKTRTVVLQGNEPLTANYSVQPGVSPEVAVTMDFGDGTVDQTTTSAGTFSHTYACAATSCTYTVRLGIVDGNGVSASQADHSVFTVIVRR
jgi:hypothetical protein